MALMSYTSAMSKGFVPRFQEAVPQMPQAPTLAGGFTGIGVGQDNSGSLVPQAQGDAGGNVLGELMAPSGAEQQMPAQQQGGTMRQNITPDIRGQLKQGMGLTPQPVITSANGVTHA